MDKYIAFHAPDMTVTEFIEDELLAAGFAPVVQCKDCEFYHATDSPMSAGVCYLYTDPNKGMVVYVEEDDFCSYSESKVCSVGEREDGGMKITRTADDVQARNERRRKANEGCGVCPCCGETKNHFYYKCRNIWDRRGIDYGLTAKRWTKGIFIKRHMRIDVYHCGTCGADWESNPYEEYREK